MATWGGTKTNYSPDNAVTNVDVNRRETNLEYLKDEADGLRQDFDDNINQGVKISDSPTFAGVSSTGPLIGTTLNTGQGANELYEMDQDVKTTDSPTFANIKQTVGSQIYDTSPTENDIFDAISPAIRS